MSKQHKRVQLHCPSFLLFISLLYHMKSSKRIILTVFLLSIYTTTFARIGTYQESLDNQITTLTKSLSLIENELNWLDNTKKEYFEKLIKRNDLEIDLLNVEIEQLSIDCRDTYTWNQIPRCEITETPLLSSKLKRVGLVKDKNTLIKEKLDLLLKEEQKIIDDNNLKELEKKKEEQRLKEKEQNKKQAEEALMKAKVYEKSWEIEKAFQQYWYSCIYNETYNCYLWKVLTGFQLAKDLSKIWGSKVNEYLKNIKIDLEKAKSLSTDDTIYLDKLNIEMLNFEDVIKNTKKTNTSIKNISITKKENPKKSKLDTFLENLEKTTFKLSNKQKAKIYQALIKKLAVNKENQDIINILKGKFIDK